MSRPLLKNSEKLRAQYWAQAVIINSELTEYAMDDLFADPKFVNSYGYNRRRLFNRAKKGYMPYRGADREAFIDRIAAHSRRLNFTKGLYHSLFWDLLDHPKFDLAKNRKFIVKCINQLRLLHSSSIGSGLSLDDRVDSFMSKNKSNLLFKSPVQAYIEALDLASKAISISLDKVALMAGLYREVYYLGHLEFAFWVRAEYATAFVGYFSRHGCTSILKPEFLNEMDSIVLFQDFHESEHYIKRITELIHLQTPDMRMNDLLDQFLKLHEELLFNNR